MFTYFVAKYYVSLSIVNSNDDIAKSRVRARVPATLNTHNICIPLELFGKRNDVIDANLKCIGVRSKCRLVFCKVMDFRYIFN